jgi:ribonuclease-3
MKSDLTKLQNILGYHFRNLHLLTEAMMHRSFSAENNVNFDNQRLEFLGDSVMQIILTELVYERYPGYPEGPLTKIRSSMSDQTAFATLARLIGLGDFIMLGRGEIEHNGHDRDSTLSDAFEALMAAIYLDSSLEQAKTVALRLVDQAYPDPESLLQTNNPKGTLQEYCQKHFGIAPRYELLSMTGVDHDPTFTVQVSLDGVPLATAVANKRKRAEMDAAAEAVTLLKEKKIQEFQEKVQQ